MLAPGLASYTAALITDTAVPAWHDGYREMPFVFTGSAAMAAGGFGLLAAPPGESAPARNLALFGVATEAVAFERMTRRMGMTAEPYRSGRAGGYIRAGQALSVLGAAGALLGLAGGRRGRAISALSGASLMAASAATRWGVFHAGPGLRRRPEVHGRPAAGTARGPPAGTGQDPRAGTSRDRRAGTDKNSRAGNRVTGGEREAGAREAGAPEAGQAEAQPESADTRRTVIIAGTANVFVGVIKLIAGLLTGSSAMLAEAAHSAADTLNQAFLLTSVHRGQRPADPSHPFGYGQERYFWSLLAAFGIFVAGGGSRYSRGYSRSGMRAAAISSSPTSRSPSRASPSARRSSARTRRCAARPGAITPTSSSMCSAAQTPR